MLEVDKGGGSNKMLKIFKFWNKKGKLKHFDEQKTKLPVRKKPAQTFKNKKSKVANKKLRIQGKFMSYEKAMELLGNTKKQKEMGIGKVELKHIIKDHQFKMGKKKKKK